MRRAAGTTAPEAAAIEFSPGVFPQYTPDI